MVSRLHRMLLMIRQLDTSPRYPFFEKYQNF